MTKHVMGNLLSASGLVPGVVMMAAPTLESLREQQQELQSASEAIVALADEEERDLEEDEIKKINANTAAIEKISVQITARAAVVPQGQGRRTAPEAVTPQAGNEGGRRTVPATVRAKDGRNGFTNFGEFAQAVRAASVRGTVDARLMNAAATTYSSEGAGADGGYAVPPDFRATIMERVFGEERLIGMSDQLQSSSNTITFPIDMTTPWQTTGGVQAYWTAEGATKTQSKIILENVTLRLHKLAAIVPVTDELLEDAPALNGYLNRKVPEKIDFMVSFAMAWGSGAGQPLGWMNSPALVTQAAEGGQTADTINATNVVKMWSRMPTNSLTSAVWLIHPDAMPQLPLMVIGQQPVFQPPGNMSASPYGTLLGRPLIPHQIAETIGDLGDIMFVDLKQYLTITKAGGIKTDVSIHLWFDQDITAFRFVLRVGGQPWWSGSVASRDGSFTQSPFVTLAAR